MQSTYDVRKDSSFKTPIRPRPPSGMPWPPEKIELRNCVGNDILGNRPTTFSERPEGNPDDDLINSEKHQNKNQNYHQHSPGGVH